MNKALKQRLVGAAVLVALAVIFIPMLLDNPDPSGSVTVSTEIPPLPEQTFGGSTVPPSEMESPEPMPIPAPDLVKRSAPSADEAAPVPVPPAEEVPQMAEEEGAPPAAAPVPPAPVPEPVPPAVATAPPTPSPAPAPAAAADSWVVQVGSFSREQNALALRDRLRGKGFTAFVEPLAAGAETAYRVRVGPEKGREKADALRDKLEKSESLKGIVVPYP